MTKLEAVEQYVSEGYSPWPCVPDKKQPINVDGVTWGGRRHVPLTQEQRRRVWNKRPAPDILLVIPEGRFVLDLDPKNNPDVKRMFDDLIGMTRCAWTPSGGLHAFFRVTGSVPTFDPALGIDVQGRNSLVVAPPARGRKWANELAEFDWTNGAFA